MSERKAKALAFAIALAIAALPASAKTTTAKPKPTPPPKATTWTAAQIQALLTKTLDADIAAGKFIGPPGPQGPQGPAGAGGSTYPANPSANSNGGSIAGFSQLSAANLSVDQTTATKSLSVSSNATVTGGITAGSLTTAGTINATNYLQNGLPLASGASPAGCPGAGSVQLYTDSTHLGCDTAFQWDSTNHELNISGVPLTPFAGLYVGPDESALPVLLQGYIPSSNALLTSTDSNKSVLGIENSGNDNSSASLSLVTTGTNAIDIETDAYASADGAQLYGLLTFMSDSGHAAAYMAGISIASPVSTHTTDSYGIYISDQSGATNAYYSWDDSRGVRRVKEDNTFNGVGQAIEALYNPQFTKYTPGATDFERVVLGQWNSNVAEIGTQAGGSGTLRPLRLLGSQLDIPNHVNTASSNNDFDGQISISSATSASHNFATAFNSAPVCTLTPTTDPNATGRYWVTASTGAVTANVSSSGSITFNYHCIGNPN